MVRQLHNCLFTLSFISLSQAYDQWHIVDVASVICPDLTGQDEALTAPNLAAGKAVSTNVEDVFMASGAASSVTDGSKGCSAVLLGPLSGRSAYCDEPTWVQIDLETEQTINEVVLYQFTCSGPVAYCGHGVSVSTDGSTWTSVKAIQNDYSPALTTSSKGTTLRFEDATARYVKVFSGSGRRVADGVLAETIYFLEVEVFKRAPIYPEFTIGIEYGTSMDVGAPHIVTFLRTDGKDAQIELSIEDATGKSVVPRQTFTLQNMETETIPSSCECSGKTVAMLLQSEYGAVYGSYCSAWDQDNCGTWWPNALGDHCCQAWCYTDDSCPDAYRSSLIDGAYFSYKACNGINEDLDLSTCPWAEENMETADPCACQNVGNLFSSTMLTMFSEDYGSSCKAWDMSDCSVNYALSDVDTWCCSSWCYVDASCPQAQDSLNFGMQGILYWADISCEQDNEQILQCPYRKIAEATEENFELCACLEVSMPSDLLPPGAPADYGEACGSHDAEICDQVHPLSAHDMWCCTSWCWVSEACPNAQPSTIWDGHFYSGMSCDANATAILNCRYSDACECLNDNSGVDTAKFGADYGKQCGPHDSTDCIGFWENTAWWSTGRNDWCCDNWCYVSEACPLAEVSTLGSGNPFSYAACDDDNKLYQTSTNTCQEPKSCDCLGNYTEDKYTFPEDGYGLSCAPWDKAICDSQEHYKLIDCCLSFCFVDELCETALPSPTYPGNWYADQNCEKDADALRSCFWSDSCQCVGQNTGINTATFGNDYGKSCGQWDSTDCYLWWGPNSPSNLWSDTSNDWCCSEWCYVKEDCPLAEGFGESQYPFSYSACPVDSSKNLVYESENDTCIEGGSSRLLSLGSKPEAKAPSAKTKKSSKKATKSSKFSSGTSKKSPGPSNSGSKMMARTPKKASIGDSELAEKLDVVEANQPDTEGIFELPEGCHEFFMLDGRSPVELPESVEEAELAAFSICTSEGFEEAVCGAAIERVFERKSGGSSLCTRLTLAVAAAAPTLGHLSGLKNGRWGHEVRLAGDLHKLLYKRAGHDDTGTSTIKQSNLDLTVRSKVEQALRQNEGQNERSSFTVPLRRMKGSSGGGSRSRGGTYYAPDVRRRSPSRPVAAITPRRRSVSRDDSSSVRRRRSSSTTSHRRRSTDITGSTQTTPNGQAYGFTSSSQLFNNYGGRTPSRTSYGYAGNNAYSSGHTSSVSTSPGPAFAGGAVVGGVGSYYAYNSMYYGGGLSSYRRRRSGPTEWCIVPTGSRQGEWMECYECIDTYGACSSASKCNSGTGCSYELTNSITRHDNIASGFMPNQYTPGLVVKFHSISGTGFTKSDICPPNDDDVLAAQFGSLMSFKPTLFLTLTQVDELGDGQTGTASATCRQNTQYPCKNGATSGSGTSVCYGAEEMCTWLEESNEALCFCQPGYCLEGETAATWTCHQSGSRRTTMSAMSMIVLSCVLSRFVLL